MGRREHALRVARLPRGRRGDPVRIQKLQQRRGTRDPGREQRGASIAAAGAVGAGANVSNGRGRVDGRGRVGVGGGGGGAAGVGEQVAERDQAGTQALQHRYPVAA